MSSHNSFRRNLIKGLGAAAALPLIPGAAWAAAKPTKSIGRVVVVGGGFAGATAAKYLRKWSAGRIEVVLIERNQDFVSCPTSNEVLAGYRPFSDLVQRYDGLRKNWGIKVVTASVTAIDAAAKKVVTDEAGVFAYDRLVVAPGIDFIYDDIAGLHPAARQSVLHAWKAGPQTVALRQQLEQLPDGGVYALSIPKAPYRCPPGPYERAGLIAAYFKKTKPRAKVIVLDANDKIQSKEKLFQTSWQNDYAAIIEYRPNWNVSELDLTNNTLISELGDTLKADILNVLPPQRAGDIAHAAGLVNVNKRWVNVDWLTFEATAAPGIHVIGDAISLAPGMPKSGTMGNSHGKAAAAAIVQALSGRPVEPVLLLNTCYSLVDDKRAVHVSSVHRYDPEKKIHVPVAGAGGVSAEASELELQYARAWASTIWKDVLG